MIAIGSDHAAFFLKEEIKAYVSSQGHNVKDFGTFNSDAVDFSDIGIAVAESIARGECEKGLLFCGTGVGMSITANKVKGIRAVVCTEPYSAKLSREHNDTNVLCLGGRVVGPELAKMIVDIWLKSAFEGGRHARRMGKITAYEKEQGLISA